MKNLLKNKKGITLVALVVTIVVLIILAGISINLVMGDNGIINRAKQAKEMQEMSDVHDKLELIRGKVALDNETIVTWDKYKDELIKENIITGDDDVEDIENGKKQIVTDTGYVAVIEITSDGTVGKIEIIGKADSLKVNIINVAVTSETSSIKVDVTANRTENATFKYYYKTEGGEYQTSPVHEGTDLSYTITNLASNTTYTIKVEATNKNGTVEKEAVAVTIKDPTIADKKGGDVLSTTDNTLLKDDYGNEITIPAGFKIASDSVTNVTGGVVVEDVSAGNAGSQFVWVPVGKIYTDSSKTEANTKNITLSRYTFASDGTATAQGDAVINTYWQELANSSYGNTVAKNISDFKTRVTTNGGYYIGRYESRKDTNTKLTEKGTDTVYNNITQPNAATACRNMYNSTKFTSDLINSYAWDTAIVFEQTFGGNSTYSQKISVNTSLATTGTNNLTTKDVICNIYDMASNCFEWTTETCTFLDVPWASSGGDYNYVEEHSNYMTSSRTNGGPSYNITYHAFRPILYL